LARFLHGNQLAGEKEKNVLSIPFGAKRSVRGFL